MSGMSDIVLNAGANNRVKACRHGLMLYNIHDKNVGRSLDIYGEWVQAEARLMQALLRPGDTAVDVGANIGAHTVVMAQSVGKTGKVWVFKPQRARVELIAPIADYRNDVLSRKGRGGLSFERPFFIAIL